MTDQLYVYIYTIANYRVFYFVLVVKPTPDNGDNKNNSELCSVDMYTIIIIMGKLPKGI